MKEYLAKTGQKKCTIQGKNPAEGGGSYKYTDASVIPEDVDCVLVLGGDGTLLQASRDLTERDLPLLGINMGTLGYLAEVDRRGIEPALERLLAGDYAACQPHDDLWRGLAIREKKSWKIWL